MVPLPSPPYEDDESKLLDMLTVVSVDKKDSSTAKAETVPAETVTLGTLESLSMISVVTLSKPALIPVASKTSDSPDFAVKLEIKTLNFSPGSAFTSSIVAIVKVALFTPAAEPVIVKVLVAGLKET